MKQLFKSILIISFMVIFSFNFYGKDKISSITKREIINNSWKDFHMMDVKGWKKDFTKIS
ncbi:MAG: hypothetical protein ABFR36_01435 [Acidobacteriota bacterium]